MFTESEGKILFALATVFLRGFAASYPHKCAADAQIPSELGCMLPFARSVVIISAPEVGSPSQIVIAFSPGATISSKPEERKENSARELLRHAVATLAYRGGKTLRGAPDGFTDFRASEKTRTPGQILVHLSDLIDWALSMAKGKQEWHDSPVISWDEGAKRFFAALQSFDDYLASDAPLHSSAERLFQGPVSDALTHVGQIAMLRGIAGSSIRAENYFKADIEAGRVGAEQTAPQREF